MGYIIGGKLINADTYGKGKKGAVKSGGIPVAKIPNFEPIRGTSISQTQDVQSKIRAQAADISRTAPTFNDPRYTFTTLSIPTDLRTLNGLYRFFDDTDPIVGNAIRLHTEFPLASYAFSDCGDNGIQKHFEDMWDRIKGDQLLFDIGLEYWRIGNVFTFGAWNEADYMWDQFAILNPDYVTVDTTWLNENPLIKLQPDEALKRIVTTGQPKFLYKQLAPEIIKYVRLGQEIPLDPNNTFFIAHNKAPYEALGKSIIKRLLKMLIYEDRLNMANFAIATRQVIPITVVKLGDPNTGWIPEQSEIEAVKEMMACHDDQTEVLTDNGFKLFKDVAGEDKIGCFDPKTKELEYYFPTERIEYDYDGEMVQFKTGHIDLLVTPNHVMYLKQRYLKDKSWKFQYAEDVKVNSQFCSTVEWKGEIPKPVKVGKTQIPSETFFKFMGWFLSEGSVGNDLNNTKNDKEYRYPRIQITQSQGKKANDLKEVLDNLHCKCYKCIEQRKSGKAYDHFSIKGELAQYMLDLFPGGASEKYVPRWMLRADKEHLKILLDTLVAGDGHQVQNKNSVYVDYTTSSKQLADDVYEIAFKLGYAPTTHLCKMSEKHPNWKDSYRVRFSDSGVGKFPHVQKSHSSKQEPITRVPYKGKVWCFTVPTGLFVTRRNGKVSIQKNSREIDPNFTIFYHWGIDIQFYGASGKILNITPEHDRIRKLKFLGLGISEAMLSGGTATYATAYMNLEVLRQRYLHFQLRLENFIHKGLFEIVAKMCGFYKTNKTVVGRNYKGKVWGDNAAMKRFREQRYSQKTLRDLQDNVDFREYIRKTSEEDASYGLTINPKYIYPKMTWDLLSLTSDVQYRNFMMAFDKMFPGVRKVSDSTYYRILKLDGEQELRRIEIEEEEKRDRIFRDAKKKKEFEKKMLEEGLPLPTETLKPGEKAPPGGGGPGGIAPGGPVAPGGPPKGPVGKGVAEGEGRPGEKPGGGPGALRPKSVEVQQQLVEQQEITKGLSSDVKRLKKANEELLKKRETDS